MTHGIHCGIPFCSKVAPVSATNNEEFMTYPQNILPKLLIKIPLACQTSGSRRVVIISKSWATSCRPGSVRYWR